MSASMVDVAFALSGRTLPREPRRALADALEAALPALAGWPGAGVHRVKTAPGAEGDVALLPGHARLLLRVPREHAGALQALGGGELDVQGHRLGLGAPTLRELRPHNALYADIVLAGDDDEAAFLDAIDARLDAMHIACRRVCGQERAIDGGRLRGYSLMLYELGEADALRVLEQGLGEARRLGCGLFVAHRSAAAVGA